MDAPTFGIGRFYEGGGKGRTQRQHKSAIAYRKSGNIVPPLSEASSLSERVPTRLISADIKALVSLYEVWPAWPRESGPTSARPYISGGSVIAIAGSSHVGPSATCTISASPGATSRTNSKSRFGGPSGGGWAGLQPAAQIAPEGWQSGDAAVRSSSLGAVCA